MQTLRKAITFETAFGAYVADELIGEGGAGRVYGGRGTDNASVALKLLPQDKATSDQRRKFKNEIAFLAQTKHPNIVAVIDHGVAADGAVVGPFYVMQRHDRNPRERMAAGIKPEEVLPLSGQILDGVEAAHNEVEQVVISADACELRLGRIADIVRIEPCDYIFEKKLSTIGLAR
jgi:serine/threonine protein kinase